MVKKKAKVVLSPIFIINFFFFLMVMSVIYCEIKFVQERIDYFADTFYNGVAALLGDHNANFSTSVEDRLSARKWADEYIESDFTTINYIFGAGYMTRWLDYPLRQAFLDMGVVGFVYYFLLCVVCPVRMLVKGNRNSVVILCALFTLYPLFAVFSSGHPYSQVKYVPICLLSFMLCKYRNILPTIDQSQK